MSGPYYKRTANMYYRHGGMPAEYVMNWRGAPLPSGLGDDEMAEGAVVEDAAIEEAVIQEPTTYELTQGPGSLLDTGPEQPPVYRGPRGMGFYDSLSEKEKTATKLAAAAFLTWVLIRRKV